MAFINGLIVQICLSLFFSAVFLPIRARKHNAIFLYKNIYPFLTSQYKSFFFAVFLPVRAGKHNAIFCKKHSSFYFTIQILRTLDKPSLQSLLIEIQISLQSLLIEIQISQIYR